MQIYYSNRFDSITNEVLNCRLVEVLLKVYMITLSAGVSVHSKLRKDAKEKNRSRVTRGLVAIFLAK